MVRRCLVCKKLDYSSPEVSFHRFPKDVERRNLWFRILGLNDEVFCKYPELCSDHFDPKNIILKNGRKYVKPGALPEVNAPIFMKSSSSSSNSPLSPASSPSRNISNINDQQDIRKLEDSNVNNDIFKAGPSKLILQDKTSIKGIASFISSSSTLTASEQGDGSESEKLEKYSKDFIKPKKRFTTVDFTEMKGSTVMAIVYYPLTNFRKRGYVGDLSSSDFSTPRKRRKNLNLLKTEISTNRRRIHSLQMTVRRLKLRITSLQTLLSYLKEKSLITENSESTIKASISGPALDVFERMLKGPTNQKYNPVLRSFALTLAFYSPKAYTFVRNTFNRSLPHLGTISQWYRSVDGSPGFTKEALLALTLKQKESAHPILCNLVMDEMSIRKQVEWTGTKYTGYVDIGTNIDGDVLPEAREALVFLLVALNGSWKIPVGYFLLDGLNASEKSGLVRKCLEFVHESGVIITSLTFDGAPINLTVAEKLGADFSNVEQLKTFFCHPISNTKIYIYLDACHMVKLIRNCLSSQDDIKDKNGHAVKWDFVSKLIDKQNVEGLHAATKVRMRHLQWQREKMRVRLATQVLSKSVSDAINFLREDIKSPEFENSEPTADFLLHFNNLFDIFNSRNAFAKYFYKKPLSLSTATQFFEYFDILKSYILGLTLKNLPMVRSSRKTGFLGFLINMESLKNMYNDYVVKNRLLKYILTYKLSQDHLELLFGAIRSKGGYNNNPTARQFEAAYKRLLVHSQICAPNTGNVKNLENITILTAGPSNRIANTETGNNLEESQEYLEFIMKIKEDIETNYIGSNAWDLTIYSEDVVGYIAGYVVRAVKRCVTCPKCLQWLEDEISESSLQKRKTYGRLIIAHKHLVDTCRAAEKFFKFFHTTVNIFNKNINNLNEVLINNAFKNLPVTIFESFDDHFFDDEVNSEHPFQLLKLILKNYFKIRIHYEVTKKLDLTKRNRIRNINTKTILFRNE